MRIEVRDTWPSAWKITINQLVLVNLVAVPELLIISLDDSFVKSCFQSQEWTQNLRFQANTYEKSQKCSDPPTPPTNILTSAVHFHDK